jgi:hypothetical protein
MMRPSSGKTAKMKTDMRSSIPVRCSGEPFLQGIRRKGRGTGYDEALEEMKTLQVLGTRL